LGRGGYLGGLVGLVCTVVVAALMVTGVTRRLGVPAELLPSLPLIPLVLAVFVGGLLGIPGETAFALALIRRVRELALGVPGLLVWQLIEGGRA